MARIFGALLNDHDYGDESAPQISPLVFLFCMIFASLSVISMIIVACGQHPDRADSGSNNVVYYGSDSRNPNAKSGGGGGDGGGDGGGCGGGCGGCGGGCGG
ncbi:hypothetical protein COCNU_01G013010 [Cocos nucifera]|uniref:Uncharacterized protein n=1 Tax=Cocos nucifera TaxID=13894 RepID=A0A8K0HVJ1_COCNU|nr:hypothetical protein COCNU_01G013010 [Cocos nucifera]